MFLIAGGKKGLPWGHLRTHKDISALKNDNVINQYCSSLNETEYKPLARPLQTLLSTARNRALNFTMYEFNHLVAKISQVLTDNDWTHDREYDVITFLTV